LGGIAPERRVPPFAARTFKSLWRERPERNQGRPDVILWPDTFNDHFYPDTAMAAAEVLEAAGFHVVVPRADVCCGRPLYDFGMLDTAKRLLRHNLRVLREPIERGVPVVGLEPSCVSVLRDEMHNLMPLDRDADRLRQQTFLFGEFMRDRAADLELPKLQRKAVVHGHCHHKSLFKLNDEQALLERMGLDADMLDTGCCGMAGSFGFERGEKHEVSMKIGEQRILPAVRAAADGALVIADGFSCREQIRQGSARDAVHAADVARAALAHDALPGPRPERALARGREDYPLLSPALPGTVGALALAALGGAVGARLQPRSARGLARLFSSNWTIAGLGGVAAVALALAAASVSANRARRRRGSDGSRE
jgi:Fe-S oxidoreductase